MWIKKFILGILVATLIGLAFVVFFLLLSIGGPIIVVRPDPEPDSARSQCKTKACWYAGAPTAAHWNRLPDQVRPAPDNDLLIPHYWTDVQTITLTQAIAVDRVTSTTELELTLKGGDVLDLTLGGAHVPPTWKFKGTELKSKRLRDKRLWPSALLGEIMSVKYLDKDGKLVEAKLEGLEIEID